MSALAVLFVAVTLILGLSAAANGTARAASTGFSPKKTGELDCNGLSPVQHPVKRVI